MSIVSKNALGIPISPLTILLFFITASQCLRFRRDLGNSTRQGIGNDLADSPDSMIGGGGNSQMSSQMSNFRDLMFVNNGCEYHNGYIRENGGPSRKATEGEEAQVQEYLRRMDQYQEGMQRGMAAQMEQMSQQMSQMFAPPFPFGGGQRQPPSPPHFPAPQFAQMPQFPCLCENCKRQAVPGNAANSYNQYSVIGQGGGGQTQQMGQQAMMVGAGNNHPFANRGQ